MILKGLRIRKDRKELHVADCELCSTYCIFKLQAEAKKLEDAATYLSLPSTKAELEEKGHSATGKSMQSLGSCTISKDSFQISTLVCSTKLTQNGEFGVDTFSPQDLFSLRLHPFCCPCWVEEASLGA